MITIYYNIYLLINDKIVFETIKILLFLVKYFKHLYYNLLYQRYNECIINCRYLHLAI